MIEEIIESYLQPDSHYIYGFADLTGLLAKKFEGFNWGISIGRLLDLSIIDTIVYGPTKEYYFHYRDINKKLGNLTGMISKDLNAIGIKSINIEPTVTTSEIDSIYSETLITDISHKMVATRAGLGWIGKTDLFISKKAGPRLRLVSILINKPVSPETRPVNKSLCGKCNLCVDNCPAKAANGRLWNISVSREDFFDPWKCRKQCAEYGRVRLGMDARVCGICVAICPIGREKMS